MNLYYIRANHPDFEDEDQDLLVRAESPEQAEGFWRDHYEVPDDHAPISIIDVPVNGPAGAIPWNRLL